MTTGPIPRVLTIAASDSSGAAGLQADLKTYEARGVYGMSAVTALTAQDSTGIHAFQLVPVPFIKDQIRAVLTDIGADAVKTGLLLRADVITGVHESLSEFEIRNFVVDPVLVAGDGRRLADDAAVEAYRILLFPRAAIITPNLDEAAILTGQTVTTPEGMRAAARTLCETGVRNVLVKGGHLPGSDEMIDVLYDGADFHEFRTPRLLVANARGTGCTFASCIAAELARGKDIPSAVSIAQKYVAATLAAAADWRLGTGRGTVFHSVGRPPLFDDRG